jgi:hypothetical protein
LISGWIKFQVQELHAVLLRRLHEEVDALLKLRVEDPSRDISARQSLLVRVVEVLLGAV